MAENTAIEWTDATWNPGQACTKVDGDCKFCYMYRDKERYGQDPTTVVRSSKATFDGILNPKKYAPGSLVFTASWSDWWHPGWDGFRGEAFDRIDRRRDLTFQVLTKRPERIAGTLPATWGADGWPHVWLGTSVGNPKGADRARVLADIPAVVRFLSIEPLWAPGVADALRDVVESGRIDWIILGGESGPNARPMHPAWAREIRDLALGANVPLILKQWGEHAPVTDAPRLGDVWVCPRPMGEGKFAAAHTQLWRPGDVGAAAGRWHPNADAVMRRVGKKAAGRTLDGVIHDAYPMPRVPHAL